MFLIVAWHSTVHGIYSHGQFAYELADWTLLPFLLTCWHVDGFVAISGWYGIRFKPSKFLRLLCLIVFYSLVNYFVAKIWYGEISFVVDGGWFGGSYLMLMLLAPILNRAVTGGCGTGIILMLFGVTLQWSPYTRDFTGVNGYGAGAYSLFMMMCIYLVARWAREAKIHCGLKRLACMAIIFIAGMVFCGGSFVAHKLMAHSFVSFLDWQHFSYYNAPYVLLFAVAVVVSVGTGRIKFPFWIGRVCAWLGPSMFAVYLMHDVSVYGYDFYLPLQKVLYKFYHFPSFVVLFLSTVFTFVCCVGIDLIRRLLLYPFRRLMDCVYKKIDGKYDGFVSVMQDKATFYG